MTAKHSSPSLSELARLHAELAALPDDLPLDPVRASNVLQAMGIRMGRQMLAKTRCEDRPGPRFHKRGNGRVVYLLGDLRAFAGISPAA
ncbi:hypothetical protein ACFFP0_31705 [Rhizobium puerariae]|uniref:DNA-binding protein n=1 Tax=Rhizobium puerariae TaxID=1585791 RepID=A0ABV6ASB9_9HYPH